MKKIILIFAITCSNISCDFDFLKGFGFFLKNPCVFENIEDEVFLLSRVMHDAFYDIKNMKKSNPAMDYFSSIHKSHFSNKYFVYDRENFSLFRGYLNPNYFDDEHMTIVGKNEENFNILAYKKDTFVIIFKTKNNYNITTGNFDNSCILMFKGDKNNIKYEGANDVSECMKWQFYRDLFGI